MTAGAAVGRSSWWLSGPTHGFWLWYATLSGIGWWLVHLTALSALVELSCGRPLVEWVMHGLTVGLSGATILAAWLSYALVRGRRHHSEADPDLDGRLRFMGLFGLLTELISLLLIVWEGIYVAVIDACR